MARIIRMNSISEDRKSEVATVPCRRPRSLVILAICVSLAGCTAGGPTGNDSPATADPSMSAVHYGVFGGEVCGEVAWDILSSELGLEVTASLRAEDGPDVPPSPDDTLSDSLWYAECDIEGFRTDADMPMRRAAGHVIVVGYPDPPDAHQRYVNQFEEAQRRSDSQVVAPIEGWWDDGFYEEQWDSARIRRGLDLNYHLYHENLYVWVWLTAAMSSGVREEGSEVLHKFARGVIDAVEAPLPVEGGS